MFKLASGVAPEPASTSWWQRLVDWFRAFLGQEKPKPPPLPLKGPPSQIIRVGEERRSHVRVPIELRVAVRFDTIEDVLRSHTVDLSHGGVFIATTSPRSVGTKVRLALTVGEQSVDLTGTVVRRVSPAEAVGGPPGMGVNFEGLTPDAQALVDQIVGTA